MLLALGLALGGTVPAAQAAKGSTFSKASWSSRSVDGTLANGSSEFKVRIKDSTPISSATAIVENGTYGYKSLYLTLDEGTNRNGVWVATGWFGTSDKGTWRVTQLTTTNQDGYVYRQKSKSGIGGKVKVTVGVKSKLKLSTPKKAVAGKKVSYSATLTRKGKPVAGAKVQLYVDYYDSKGNYKYKIYKVKTSKKGVAKITKKFPAAQTVGVYASYAGKKRSTQASYANKSISRTWIATKVTTTVAKSAAPGASTKVTVKVTKKKKALAGQKVVVSVSDSFGYTVKSQTVKTNKKGNASVSFTMPSADAYVYASVSSATHSGWKSASVTAAAKLTLSLSPTTLPSYSDSSTAKVTFGSPVNGGRVVFYVDGQQEDYTNIYGSTKTVEYPLWFSNWSSSPQSRKVQAVWQFDADASSWYTDWRDRGTSNTVTVTVPAR